MRKKQIIGVCNAYEASCGHEFALSPEELQRGACGVLCPKCGLPVCSEDDIKQMRKLESESPLGKLRRAMLWLRYGKLGKDGAYLAIEVKNGKVSHEHARKTGSSRGV